MPINLQKFTSPITSRLQDFLPDEEEKERLRQQFREKAIEIAEFVKKPFKPKPLLSPISEKEGERLSLEGATPSIPSSQEAFKQRLAIEKPSIKEFVETKPSPKPEIQELARNPNITKFKITSKVNGSITRASKKFDLPPTLLFDIALQESSFDAGLVNITPEGKEAGNPTGLFQFTDDTWETIKNYANDKTTSLYNVLPNFDRKDPLTNSLAAAYLIKFGQLGRWDASRGVWGEHYSDEELESYYSQRL